MKRNTLMVLAGIIFLACTAVFGQSLEYAQEGVSEKKELTAAMVLEDIVANAMKKKIPLEIYPPGYLDWLQKMGDEPMPKQETKKVSAFQKSGGSVAMQKLFNPLTQKFQIIDLGTLGGNESSAQKINNQGQIVGLGQLSNNETRAFLWLNGSLQNLGVFAGNDSRAYGVNNNKQVVGQSTTTTNLRAFLWSNGLMQNLGNMVVAYNINDYGQVAGYYSHSSGKFHAAIWSNGSLQDLGVFPNTDNYARDINNNGQVVGWGQTNGNYYTFLWADGTIQDLGTPSSVGSYTTDINNNGQVVGYRYNPSAQAFLWFNGSLQDLGSLGGNSSEAYAINDHGQIVGGSYTGSRWHAFLLSEGTMYDLNSLVNYNISPTGWELRYAHGINDEGQIVGVGRKSGQNRAFLLNPLPEGWEGTITDQPDSILYSALPDRQEGETNLILITHGNNPDINWLRNLTNTIGQGLQGIPGWRVASYEWEERANHPLNPGKSLSNAIEDGLKGGRKLATNGWEHIHMIAHSAGSGFIEYATRTITNISPNVVVHTTFLDAFVGYLKGQENEYGASSDWSDSYITKTTQPFTRSILPNTYSVDVTDLDQVTHNVPVFLDWYLSPCTETVADHGWPYRFYSNTVTGAVTSEYKGFGYPLSKEGGGYDLAKMLYPKGGSTNLGIPPTCNESILEGDVVETPVSPSTVPSYKVGTVLVNTGAIELRTASPSLISLALYLTNDADTVNFEARYTTTNANPKGLLTSYWDTNILGQLDEEAVLPGLQRYTYKFPMSSANSTHMLGFRIDPFTNVSSSIIITNVTYGLSGPRENFTLSVTTNTVGGKPVFELKGDAGFAYSLEASTNLINWETIAKLANTNGTVRFYDPSPSTYGQRFYRAVVPR